MSEGRPETPRLFDVGPRQTRQPIFEAPQYPLWTERKAELIASYLYYFVLITKHGTYIDGFAGPQSPAHRHLWAAKKVLEVQPPWLRHFHLFEIDADGVAALQELKAQHHDRNVNIYHGDFNQRVRELLAADVIGTREATFCLLDQRTTECHWSTVTSLARHRLSGFKFELFYFLAQGWLDRTLAATSTQQGIERLNNWWGRSDWHQLRALGAWDRARAFVKRFRQELSYKYVSPYAIYGSDSSGGPGRIMYFMIHASDHREAPKLMNRAYKDMIHSGTDDGAQDKLI